MDDLDTFIKHTEDTVAAVRRAIAEYEASADQMDRLREEAMRQIKRYGGLQKRKDVPMDWAVDMFLEANELKMAVFESVGEIEDAVNDLVMSKVDLFNVDTYPGDILAEFEELPEDEQKLLRDELAAAKSAARAPTKPKAPRPRMSV